MSTTDFHAMRAAMVKSQLRTSDVNDPAILAAMSAVPRERFVDDAQAQTAYHDRLIPIGQGRVMNPPLVTGRMLTELMPLPNERALVIAGGTGYVAAVLSYLVSHVTMVEDDAALVARAKANLSYRENITVVEAPLVEGPADQAPFDCIFSDGAIDECPPTLTRLLVDDGRLVTGLVDRSVTRLAIGRRAGDAIPLFAFAEMEIAPLPAFRREEAFRF